MKWILSLLLTDEEDSSEMSFMIIIVSSCRLYQSRLVRIALNFMNFRKFYLLWVLHRIYLVILSWLHFSSCSLFSVCLCELLSLSLSLCQPLANSVSLSPFLRLKVYKYCMMRA